MMQMQLHTINQEVVVKASRRTGEVSLYWQNRNAWTYSTIEVEACDRTCNHIYGELWYGSRDTSSLHTTIHTHLLVSTADPRRTDSVRMEVVHQWLSQGAVVRAVLSSVGLHACTHLCTRRLTTSSNRPFTASSRLHTPLGTNHDSRLRTVCAVSTRDEGQAKPCSCHA